jgi:hypothetical protein
MVNKTEPYLDTGDENRLTRKVALPAFLLKPSPGPGQSLLGQPLRQPGRDCRSDRLGLRQCRLADRFRRSPALRAQNPFFSVGTLQN